MRILLLMSFILFSCSSQDCGFRLDEFDKYSTLDIESYIHDESDCGEWGGHRERLTFSRLGEKYKVVFIRDSSDCIRPGLKDQPEGDSLINKEFKVNIDKVKMTMDYLSKLNNHKPSWNISSNAPNHYTVKFKNAHKTVEITIDDSDNSWTLYKGFKEELLKQ